MSNRFILYFFLIAEILNHFDVSMTMSAPDNNWPYNERIICKMINLEIKVGWIWLIKCINVAIGNYFIITDLKNSVKLSLCELKIFGDTSTDSRIGEKQIYEKHFYEYSNIKTTNKEYSKLFINRNIQSYSTYTTLIIDTMELIELKSLTLHFSRDSETKFKIFTSLNYFNETDLQLCANFEKFFVKTGSKFNFVCGIMPKLRYVSIKHTQAYFIIDYIEFYVQKCK